MTPTTQASDPMLWSNVSATITTVKDAALLAGAVVAIYVGLKGLSTWRRQLKGNTEYDLARRVLKTTFRLRDEISSCRSPFMTGQEQSAAMKAAGVEQEEAPKYGTPEYAEWSQRAVTEAYNARWRLVAEAASALRLELVEAEVLWEGLLKEPKEKLFQQINLLHYYLGEHLDRRRNLTHRHEHDREFDADIRKHVFRGLKDDPVEKEVNEAIASFERLVRCHLRK